MRLDKGLRLEVIELLGYEAGSSNRDKVLYVTDCTARADGVRGGPEGCALLGVVNTQENNETKG